MAGCYQDQVGKEQVKWFDLLTGGSNKWFGFIIFWCGMGLVREIGPGWLVDQGSGMGWC